MKSTPLYHCGTCENIFTYHGKPRACPECRSSEIERHTIEPEHYFEAIIARINGEWDNKPLSKLGALSPNLIDDIEWICKRAVIDLEIRKRLTVTR